MPTNLNPLYDRLWPEAVVGAGFGLGRLLGAQPPLDVAKTDVSNCPWKVDAAVRAGMWIAHHPMALAPGVGRRAETLLG